LIPFSEAASFEHLISTRGGNVEPGSEKTLLEVKAVYEQLNNARTDPNVLKRAKAAYDKAIENVKEATMPAWNKIDPQDVVCRDSPLLTATPLRRDLP
jgi:hypothetical protein